MDRFTKAVEAARLDAMSDTEALVWARGQFATRGTRANEDVARRFPSSAMLNQIIPLLDFGSARFGDAIELLGLLWVPRLQGALEPAGPQTLRHDPDVHRPVVARLVALAVGLPRPRKGTIEVPHGTSQMFGLLATIPLLPEDVARLGGFLIQIFEDPAGRDRPLSDVWGAVRTPIIQVLIAQKDDPQASRLLQRAFQTAKVHKHRKGQRLEVLVALSNALNWCGDVDDAIVLWWLEELAGLPVLARVLSTPPHIRPKSLTAKVCRPEHLERLGAALDKLTAGTLRDSYATHVLLTLGIAHRTGWGTRAVRAELSPFPSDGPYGFRQLAVEGAAMLGLRDLAPTLRKIASHHDPNDIDDDTFVDHGEPLREAATKALARLG